MNTSRTAILQKAYTRLLPIHSVVVVTEKDVIFSFEYHCQGAPPV